METRLAYPSLDVASLSALVAAFSSDDEREVVAAMDLVASQQEVRAIPVVMLFHPSRMVILRALELFEQHNRQGFAWAVNRLRVEAGDPAVRSAALSAYARQHGDPSALHAGLLDENETVRLTALVGLVAGGWMAGDEAARALGEAAGSASMAGKLALASAIRAQPSNAFEDVLVMLADTSDLALRAQVAGTMARMPRPLFMPPLLAMLSESSLRDPARHALVAIGQPALDFLAANLDDRAVPRRIRLHIPRTISRFAPAEAVPVLWRRLQNETDEAIRFKILRGLGRLIAEAPDVRPSAAAIAGAIRSASRTGLRLATWRAALLRHPQQQTPTEIETLLIQYLADRQARVTEAIFRLLGLTDTKEDFERVFRGLHGGRMDRASGRELVEAEVPPSERDAVLALMDEPSDPARLARFVDSEASIAMTHEQALEAVIRNSNGALRTIAERRAAELGLISAHGTTHAD
jgi:AAA family ATP:ADP antiporter